VNGGKTFEIAALTPGLRRCALFLTDITEHKKAAEALCQSQSELAAIYDHAPNMMFVLDQHQRVLRANQAVLQFTGRKALEVPGMPVGALLGCGQILEAPLPCGHGVACEICGLYELVLETIQKGKSHRRTELKLALAIGERTQETIFWFPPPC